MIRPGTRHLAGDRWTAFETTLRFAGANLTGAVMEAHIRTLPDTPGSPLVDLDTVTTPNTQGLRVISVSTDTVANHIAAGRLKKVPRGRIVSDVIPVSFVQMRINESVMETMPPATELGSDAVLSWDLLINPAGGIKQRWLKGTFTVEAGSTQ